MKSVESSSNRELNQLADFETDYALDIVAGFEELPLPEPNVPVRLVPDRFDFDGWSRRTPLKRLLQPKGFAGPLSDIVVTPLEDPLDQLLSSRERGAIRIEGIRTAVKIPKDPVNQHVQRALTRGFEVNYHLTVRGVGAHVMRSEFFLVPVLFSFTKNNDGEISAYRQSTDSYGGMVVSRVVMQPEVSQESLDRLAGAHQGYGQKTCGSQGAVRTGRVGFMSTGSRFYSA
jgi:hypothetical protein